MRRTTTFVSIASTSARLCHDRGVHFFNAQRMIDVDLISQHSRDVLDLRRRKVTRRLQEHSITCLLNFELRSWSPFVLLANRLGQDHLTFLHGFALVLPPPAP